MWRNERLIPDGRQEHFAKVSSWFNDEKVQLAVREYLAQAREGLLLLNYYV